jgi:hypothetical protein
MDSREEIDAQIAVLEQQIRELRARRNATVGLCRLPSELVVHIIKSAYTHPTEDVKDDNLHAYYKPSPSFVLSQDEIEARATARTMVMHVCHHLRQVALDARELWSLFDLKRGCDPRRLEAQMALAGEAPLTISATGAIAIDGWVASRLGNTKSARLYLGEDMKELAAALATSKSLLRQLDITSIFSGSYSIDSTFLGGCCENLTHLSLERVVINVPPILPSLIYLRICELRDDVWIKTLATVLHRSPRLEELFVEQISKQESPSAVHGYIQQACLPLLREVQVRTGNACRLHDVLRLIPPPRKHFSAVQLSTDDVPKASSEHLYALLKTFWPRTTYPVGMLTLSPVQRLDRPYSGQAIGLITLKGEMDSLSGSGPAFSFGIRRCNASEIGPSYWLNVHTLQLPVYCTDQLVKNNSSWWHRIEELSSLRTLVLSGALGKPNQVTKWEDVISWLGQRAIAGDTINTLVYSDSLIEMPWYTTAVIERLMLRLVRRRVTTADNKKILVMNRAVWRQQGMADRVWVA